MAAIADVPVVFGLVVPTVVPEATVPVPVVPLATVVAPGTAPELVLGAVPMGVPAVPLLAGAVDPEVLDVAPVEVTEVPAVLPVVDPVAFVCATELAVVFPWLLVLPTWPVFSFGLT